VRSVRAWQRQRVVLGSCDILVDALFGTGISAPLDGLQRTIVEDVNACGVPVVSIDLPSGLSADRTAPIGPAIAAWLTVTLGAPKLPLVMSPADAHTGALVVADIGIPRRVIEAVDGPRVEYTLRDDVRGLLPARADDSHKGTFGRVCVVAGSRGKSGAAHLAGMAALKSGAGLVSIATPCSCAPVVASMAAEYMTTGLNETADGCLAGDSWKAISVFDGHVVVMGPGIGTGAAQQACVERVLAKSRRPLVLDADALTVLAMSATPLKARRGQVVVVTPHPGEMARLVGGSVADVQARRIDVARDYACERGVIVVLKGHRTVIAAPDGRVFVNSTGNPGMATGGSGDVLSGAIAAWLAQLDDAVDACRLAVYLHGFAGDMAAQVEGQPGMTAGDILRHLGAAQIALARPEEADADV
jgi:NAD(P)H-hydrate epimerase